MTGVPTTERAPGKINLCLVLGPARDEDGRHELVSVMQSVTLADALTLTAASGHGDEVVCPGVGGHNLVTDALELFREATGWAGDPVRITIDKRVPVAAGMGGGSGDAAAALRILSRVAGDAAHHLDLVAVAGQLGADVPAQVRPGRALALGAGERVRFLPPGPPLGVLVLPGRRPLSTAAVYGQADAMGLVRDDLPARRVEVERHLAALPASVAVNDLEPAALALAPEIADCLDEAREAGADHAMVSGSGPTALGLFTGEDGPRRARDAAQRIGGDALACEALR